MTANMTKIKKSPLKAKPLRNPGQSIDEEIQDLWDDILLGMFQPIGFVGMAIVTWIIWLTQTPANPALPTAVAIGITVYSIYKDIRIYREIQRLKMARDGEMAVGQYLDDLRAQGCAIFHDIRGEGFNLDHVVLSPHGFFTVETKTFSKPAKGNAEITMKDGHLYANGSLIERNPLNQAQAQAKWLQELLLKSTGKRFPIRPVIVFPGWFVQRAKRGEEVWVLNPKALPTFISNEPTSIPLDDTYLAAYHLSRYVRSQ